MELKEMQVEVDNWVNQFAEGYWSPLAMLASLVEEVGELAREINHVYGEKRKKAGSEENDLALELGDVLFVLLCYANSLNIDLEDAFKRVMAKYRQRDSHRWTPKNAGNNGGKT